MPGQFLRCATPAVLGLALAAAGPAAATTIAFTTTGTVTAGTDSGTFGVGTPSNPADLAGFAYSITQRFPVANITSTGNSGPGYDDQFAYFSPGGSADVTINGITVTLTFDASAPTQNYFGMDNGLDPVPGPIPRDIIYGQQANYLPASSVILTFVAQTILSTTMNLIDGPDLQQSIVASLSPGGASQITVFDFDYAQSTWRVDFTGTPTTLEVTTLTAVVIPAPPSFGVLLVGLAGFAGATALRGRRRAAAH